MDEILARERADRRHKLARIEELIRQTPSQHVEPADLKAAIRAYIDQTNADLKPFV